MGNKRLFYRLPYLRSAELVSEDGAVHKGELNNISLRGAMMIVQGRHSLKNGGTATLRLVLSQDGTQLSFSVQLAHVSESGIGMEFTGGDLDMMVRLRGLLSASGADDAAGQDQDNPGLF